MKPRSGPAAPRNALLLILGLAAAIPGGGARAADARKEAAILAAEDRRCFSPDLFPYLNDRDAEIRARAALAAGRIGDPRAIDPLAALLADRDATVRRLAAFALGEIEDSAAAEPLAWRLRPPGEAEPAVRASMIEAIGKLGVESHRAGAVAALRDSSAAVRASACLAVWRLGAASAIPGLLLRMDDAEPAVREAAVYAVVRLLGIPASGRTPVPGGVSLPESLEAPARAALLRAAEAQEPEMRLMAVRGLSRLRNEIADAVLAGALSDPDWRVRVEAARAAISPPAGVDPSVPPPADGTARLLKLLDDANPNVRLVALEGLGGVPPGGRATEALREFLARESIAPREREVASLALATRVRDASVDAAASQRERLALAESLMRSPEWSLRAAAVAVIEAIDGDEAAGILETLARDAPKVAKEAIAPLLNGLAARCPAGTPLLDCLGGAHERFLQSPDPVIRSLALDALGSIRADSSGPPLPDEAWLDLLASSWERASSDRDNDVRLTIAGLLAPLAREGRAATILKEALATQDLPLRRAALEGLAGADSSVARAPVPSLDRVRGEDEYLRILEWAAQEHRVVIDTERGPIAVLLDAKDAPLTCWNFARLADAGFFDAGRWHRIVPNFVVQDGCPRGDGYGGPGYQIRCEINELRYATGAVGMALSGKDTGGSQFFITQSPQWHLDGRYTVFGHVIEGMDVADVLIQGDAIRSIREQR